MDKIDILEIDLKIQKSFNQEYQNISIYQNKLKSLKEITNSRFDDHISNNIKALEDKIKECEIKSKLNFYISETVCILEEYKKLLRIPTKISFMKPKPSSNEEINEIKKRYLIIAKDYYDINISIPSSDTIKCLNCSNVKNFDVVDDISYVCRDCGYSQEKRSVISSYCDINRVNIVTKYSYDRKIHFRDCLNQYQGTQSSYIDPNIYIMLETELENHNLLVGDRNTPKEIRFEKVTKKHILLFLRELGFSKQYENIVLIHYTLTGKKPDNISHLFDRLLTDFDILLDTYDKLVKNTIDRKSFINSHCVLYQLLVKYKHPCNKEDFNILKTHERQTFHDDITSKLFEHLGWQFTPIS